MYSSSIELIEKIEARILVVLQKSRRNHRENGHMGVEEIRSAIGSQFGKHYGLQKIYDRLVGFVFLGMIEEISAQDTPLAKRFRITEKGCALVAEIKKYAQASPDSRYAELLRPSLSPNVPQN